MNESFQSLPADEELDVQEDELIDEGTFERDTLHPPRAAARTYSAPPRSTSLARARTHIRPGEVVAGKYRVERRIGDSGLATLLQARHLVLDESATLKYLRPEAHAFPEAVTDFLQGARRLAQLRSEHLARVLDVGMLDFGTPYLVTEQPEGPDLSQVIRVRGALPIAEAVSYLLQASDALGEAHDLGVVHGGLNTENIFLCRAVDGTPVIRVVDFATSTSELGDMSSGVGVGMLAALTVPPALRYLSPEHARDPGHIDARADVWALGVILHELLSGRPLYHEKTVPGLLAKIVADPPTPIRVLRPEVSRELEEVLFRCLEKDKYRRFPSARAFQEALANVLGSLEQKHERTPRDPRASTNHSYSLGSARTDLGGYSVAPAESPVSALRPTGAFDHGGGPAVANLAESMHQAQEEPLRARVPDSHPQANAVPLTRSIPPPLPSTQTRPSPVQAGPVPVPTSPPPLAQAKVDPSPKPPAAAQETSSVAAEAVAPRSAKASTPAPQGPQSQANATQRSHPQTLNWAVATLAAAAILFVLWNHSNEEKPAPDARQPSTPLTREDTPLQRQEDVSTSLNGASPAPSDAGRSVSDRSLVPSSPVPSAPERAALDAGKTSRQEPEAATAVARQVAAPVQPSPARPAPSKAREKEAAAARPAEPSPRVAESVKPTKPSAAENSSPAESKTAVPPSSKATSLFDERYWQ